MTNKNLLYGEIVAKGLNASILAREIGIAPHSLFSKANGRSDFKGEEIKNIARILDLTPEEIFCIFFAD